jgi:hypothetical protein
MKEVAILLVLLRRYGQRLRQFDCRGDPVRQRLAVGNVRWDWHVVRV